MTENEALNIIFAQEECEAREHHCDKDKCDECELFYMQGTVREHKKALQMAINALSEIQQYRAIGTVEDIQMIFQLCKDLQVMCGKYHEIGTIEEFKALKEKNEPKKPIIHGLGQRYCPVCKCGGADHFYCARCGQKLG